MQTDTVFAYQVEEGDFIVDDGEVVGEVIAFTDDHLFLYFTLKDEDGDVTMWPVGPFETVFIVTRFYEDVEFEDVPVED